MQIRWFGQPAFLIRGGRTVAIELLGALEEPLVVLLAPPVSATVGR